MINSKLEVKFSSKYIKQGIFAQAYLLRGEKLHELRGETKYISSEFTVCIDSKLHIIDHFAINLNHSENPNTTITDNILFAIKDVPFGTELTIDWNDHKMHCGLHS